MNPVPLAGVAVFAPLVTAGLLIVAGPLRRTGLPAAWLSVLGAIASVVASVSLLVRQWGEPHEVIEVSRRWLPGAGETVVTVGALLDGVSVPMMAVVCFVALMVQIFSLEYLADEPPEDLGRYYTAQSLFLFSMLGLVVAPNALQLFACWELVGLCSYLLIGYWWRKPSAARAAVKAFWVTKFADMGLLLGLIVLYVATGSFGWEGDTVVRLVEVGAAPAVAALFFLAVMGKSAQFPLHVWLPDAMEGPTPVSALLHAATMVAAGVYLVVRAWPVFAAAESVLTVMACIGGLTALLAACMAVVQTDIKRVLAYSTCSQLGYMVAALGAGSLLGGYFHLTTHAFFKALLFLGAGSIIHGVHSNELTDMGGLGRKMPWTATTFGIGVAALAGVPMMSGFVSKDLVLEGLLHGAEHNPVLWAPFLACFVTVGLTAYYMGRVFVMAFLGSPSEAASHAHEGGIALRGPLVLLALLAVAAGWPVGDFAEMVGVSGHVSALHLTPVGGLGIVAAAAGFGVAWWMHGMGGGAGLASALAPVGAFIRSAPIDRAYEVAYRHGLNLAAGGLAWFDRYVIDGLMNATGALTLMAGSTVRRAQTGRVTDYLYAVVGGLLFLAVWSSVMLLGASCR